MRFPRDENKSSVRCTHIWSDKITYIVGFCPSCFTFTSFSSPFVSLDDDEECFEDDDGVDDDDDELLLGLLKLDDCGVVGDCEVLSSFDKLVGVPP